MLFSNSKGRINLHSEELVFTYIEYYANKLRNVTEHFRAILLNDRDTFNLKERNKSLYMLTYSV